jgi:PAS domain S-box-containing protein
VSAWPPPLRHTIPLLFVGLGAVVSTLVIVFETRNVSAAVAEQYGDRVRLVGVLAADRIEAAYRQRSPELAVAEVVRLNADRLLDLAAVVDAQGRIVHGSRFELDGHPVAETELRDHRSAIAAALLRRRDEIEVDRRWAVGVFPLERSPNPVDGPGALVIRLDLSTVRAAARRQAQAQGAAIIAIFAAASLGAWLFLRRAVTRRAAVLVDAAGRIADGAFQADVPLRGADEFAQLADAFRAMAARLDQSTADLRERERRFRQLIERGSDIITILAPDATMLYASPSVERILGHAQAAMVGRSVIDFMPADEHDRVRAAVADAFAASGFMEPRVYRSLNARGRERRLEAIANHPAEDPDRLIVTARDITERVDLEQQLRHAQKMEAVGQLAGGVAHDFNNLLTAILGYCEQVLGRSDLPQAAREDVQEIRRSADSGAVVTRRLLAFSRRQVTRPVVLDLDLVLADLRRMLERLLGPNITIITEPGAPGACVYADPGEIEQVLVNLVVNARDAMPHGGELRLATCFVEPSGREAPGDGTRFVRLTVADNGSGMTEDVRRRAFEPFFTTKERGQGTGLGLAIVYGIVNDAGGAIRIEEVPGGGTAFVIDLPAVGPAAVDRTDGGPSAEPAEPVTILFVEDEPRLLALGQRVLGQRGHRVVPASSGAEALARLAELGDDVDLLVTDVLMPGMDGRELARCVWAERPHLRVLFVSGYPSDPSLPLESLGEVSFLPKPFTLNDLVERVAALARGVAEERAVNRGGRVP